MIVTSDSWSAAECVRAVHLIRWLMTLTQPYHGVIHFHGHWRTPESVVLGYNAYRLVVGDEAAQTIQRAMAALSSFVFVGFGAGLEDPNFGALLEWMALNFPEREALHFRLVRDADVARAAAPRRSNRVVVLTYGSEYADMPAFLKKLATHAGCFPVPEARTGAHSDAHDEFEKDVRASRLELDFTTGYGPNELKLRRHHDGFFDDFWSNPRYRETIRFDRNQVVSIFSDGVREALARVEQGSAGREARRRVRLCTSMFAEGAARILNYAMTEVFAVQADVALFFFAKGVYAMLLAALHDAGEALDGMRIPWAPYGSAFHHPRLSALYGAEHHPEQGEKLVDLEIFRRGEGGYVRVSVGAETEVGKFFSDNPQLKDDFAAWEGPFWVSRYLVPQMVARSFLSKGPVVSDFAGYLIACA